jgi:3-phenylpropionate/trans-cinnamate dioxygenase ferredoxin component
MSETVNERGGNQGGIQGGIRVARLEDVQPGEMTTVEVEDVKVLLANVGGTVRALRDSCSHEEAPLSEGELEGETVVCPWHFSSFCLRTGEALEMPAVDPVEAYAVHVVDGEVFLSRQ